MEEGLKKLEVDRVHRGRKAFGSMADKQLWQFFLALSKQLLVSCGVQPSKFKNDEESGVILGCSLFPFPSYQKNKAVLADHLFIYDDLRTTYDILIISTTIQS